MQVTILSITKETVKTAKGSYQKAEVAYKDDQGKVTGKKIMSFTNQKVFDILAASNTGDVFNVTSKKDDNGFWQWVDISKVDSNSVGHQESSAPVASSDNRSTPSPKSTYATAEERAQTQLYIVRQSSLERAIEFHNRNGNAKKEVAYTLNDIIRTAEILVDWVMIGEYDDGSLSAMSDDTDGII